MPPSHSLTERYGFYLSRLPENYGGRLSGTLTPMDQDEVLHVDDRFAYGAVPHDAPAALVPHQFELQFDVPRPLKSCWIWLNDPETFTKGQIWPYRVEFLSPDENVPPGFHVGVLNWHYGPGISFAGVVTDVRPMEYRDLRYFYGSFVISPRLLRPTRLQFWTEAIDEQSTHVRLQVDSLVRKRWLGTWTWMQRRFWSRFPAWMKKASPETN
ncbi:MAG: hypothetical protein AAF802_24325 [Planctomycetota bacterium]